MVWFPDFKVYIGKQDFPDVPKEPIVKIVPREEWGAAPPVSTVPLQTPVEHIRYTFTATPESTDPATNIESLKMIQKLHMDRLSLPDIQYNFIIGGDGTVYEGRGWQTDSWKPAQHANLQGKSIDIAYMGDYTKEGVEPNWEMSKAGQNLLKFGVEQQYIKKPFKITYMRE